MVSFRLRRIATTREFLPPPKSKELVQADDSLAIETGICKFIEWIRSGKLEVKLYREQNIHAKVYIMTPEHPVPDVNHGYVITGSSNLSYSGLEGNLEFNVLLGEPEEHDYALHGDLPAESPRRKLSRLMASRVP